MLVPRRSVASPFFSSPSRGPALVGLRPLEAVAPHGQVQLLRQGVDHRHADAVQAAGDLVATALAELAAGVQHREHHLGGGALLLLVHVDRDAAAVVGDGDGVVRVDRDLDVVGLAGEGLVDRVVHHLVDQVVQAAHTGRADVHAGTLAHRLEPLEDGDVLRAVARRPVRLVVFRRQAVPSGQPNMRRPRPGLSPQRVGAHEIRLLILAGYPRRSDALESQKRPANRHKMAR